VRILGIGMALILGLSVGCNGSGMEVIDPVRQNTDAIYLEIEGLGDRDEAYVRRIMERSLPRYRVRVSPDKVDYVPVALGTFLEYEPGSAFLRWMLPGLGAGYLDSVWLVSDGATGEPLGQCQINGWIAWGMFGGKWHIVLRHVANELSRCLLGGREEVR